MFGLGGAETNIKAVITADDKGSSVLKGFGDNVGRMGTVVEKGLKTAAVGLAAGAAAATAFGVASVKAFTDSEDRIAQTNAVLKSTGQAAGVTADQVTKLATALEKQTRFSDEDVRSAQNLLLTFTSIGKEVFPQATKTVLDMSTALGQDTKASAIQLGKALQDPINGITALRRVGVNFSDAQKDVIKNLVDTGQTAEAQRKILEELSKEFGGSAVAAGNTFAGSLDKLKNQLNNVQEAIGGVIVQRLTPFVTKALEAVAAVDWDRVLTRTITVLREFYATLQTVVGRIAQVAQQVGEYLQPKLTALWNTLNTQVVPTLLRLWREVLQPLVPVIGTVLVVAIGALIDALNLLLTVLTPVINFMLNNRPVVIALAAAFGTLALAMNFTKIVAAFQVSMGAAMAVMNAVRLTSLAQLNTALVSFGGFGIFAAAAVGAFALVYQKGQETLNLLGTLNDQVAGQNQNDIKAMQDVTNAYKAGKISREQYQRFFQTLAPGAGVPRRANGGSVVGGQPYTVGENGQEMFVPSTSGTIIPNNKLGSGGSGTTNVVVNIGMYAGSEQEKRKVATELFKSLQEIASSKSMTVSQMLGV